MKEILTNQERINKYIKEHCNKCKNRTTNLCDIRVFAEARCVYYEGGINESRNS